MTAGLDSQNGSRKTGTIKFLYSYGGRIIPRRTDGELRYFGGFTRVLAVDRSSTYAELMVKFGELCGSSMSLRCKLPSEDLDVLVSITSNEDLANLIEEYDRHALVMDRQDFKIRALLFPINSLKQVSPPQSPVSILECKSQPPYTAAKSHPSPPRVISKYCCGGRTVSPAVGYSVGVQKDTYRVQLYPCSERRNQKHPCPVPLWNNWQKLKN